MTTSVSLTGTELAVIRRLRTAAAAGCAATRMRPHHRDLLRDALVAEAQREWATGPGAEVVALPRQRDARELETASA
jgi:hypothetical protein